MAKISVIVPIYNVEKYLRECLDSIINQTFKDLEIILVNDGSKDKSSEIINEYAQKDNRIIVIDKPNGGYGSACNAGLDKATGEYITIVEPDDYIELNMYEDLYNLAQNRDADVIKSCFYIFYDTKKFTKDIKENWSGRFKIPNGVFTAFEFPEILYFHPSIWSAIYRRDYLNEKNIRFIEAKGSGWTDNPFRVEVYCSGAKILYTDKAYYHWRNLFFLQEDSLKDITIPAKRSFEIHDWLNKNNIKNENILAFLYKLELLYIHTLLGKIGLFNYSKVKGEVRKLLSIMNKNIILENKNILTFEKNNYIQLTEDFNKYFFNFFVKNKFSLLFDIKRDLKLYFLINFNRNVILWGASLFLDDFLKKYHVKTKNIVGIVDKNSARWGTKLQEYEIYSPDFIKSVENGKIIMTIAHFGPERYQQLADLVKEEYPKSKMLPNVFE